MLALQIRQNASNVREMAEILIGEAINKRIMSVAKIVELVGSSDKGWEDAAQVAVNEGLKTLRGIRGIEVVDQTALVDSKTGKITKYRTCVKLSFGIE